MKDREQKRAHYRAYYQANKERFRKKQSRYESRLRALILAAKDRPCSDCGGRWSPLVMEMDHREGETKEFNVGDWLRLRCVGEAGLREEIAKCDVVCPTCHRIRTLKRRGLLL
jgi:hypothetical protein